MITRADVEKLGVLHAVEPAVLSLYVAVPSHPADPSGVAARAGELIAAAEITAGACLRDADRSSVLEELAASGRVPGRTVAIFACADAGLLETLALPRGLPERAVLGTRPHIRPLLVVLQRCPAHRIAVVDRRQAWLLAVRGEEIETSVTSPGDGGGQQRVSEFARYRHRDAAVRLEQMTGAGEQQPLVIGGDNDGIWRLLTGLPPTARDAFAGSFTADAGTLTLAQARDLAAPVVARWAGERARRVADEILAAPPGGRAAVGLQACLAAVNAGPVETLVVPDDGLVPGYECGRCGALSTDADSCPDWGTAPLPVPDVIEEMVTRTLEDGGQVSVVSDPPSRMAARLHLPR